MTVSHCILHCGLAQNYGGGADLVFTHPYGPFPRQLWRVPAIINLALPPGRERQRQQQAEAWMHAPLHHIARWAERGWNAIFVAHLPVRAVELGDLTAAPGGWFPEELCRRLFTIYQDCIPAGGLVWDGFMGRGTVGKIALERGYHFFGMDQALTRVQLARTYLGVSPT